MNQVEKRRLVTIIIPARNEESNIPRVRAELDELARDLPYDFEFLCIDNASSDNTGELVKQICAEDKRWKYIRFSRDFTVEMSITAGYHYASGDAMIVLYSDLQDPPDVIPRFLEKWEEGYDVIYGVRTVRPGDPTWRNIAVKWTYKLISWFSDTPIPPNTGDFRLITRQVRDAVEQCREYNRYTRGLIAWLGFRQTGIQYERRPRLAGKSNAPLFYLIWFTFQAITSFSLKPLRMFTYFGFSVVMLSLIVFPIYISGYFWGSPPRGTTTVIGLLITTLGVICFGIGILGEYIGRIYSEVKGRPLYIVSDSANVKVDVQQQEIDLIARG